MVSAFSSTCFYLFFDGASLEEALIFRTMVRRTSSSFITVIAPKNFKCCYIHNEWAMSLDSFTLNLGCQVSQNLQFSNPPTSCPPSADVIYGWPPNGDPLDVASFRYPFLLAPPFVRPTLEVGGHDVNESSQSQFKSDGRSSNERLRQRMEKPWEKCNSVSTHAPSKR